MTLDSSEFSEVSAKDRPETVSEFTRRLKGVISSAIKPCWIKGEVSNIRTQASGHIYFSLKDAGAQLSAVLFRGDAMRQTVQLKDGLQVIAFGEVGVYEARGQYQLVARVLVDDGQGKLQRELEALKKKLSAEGLFASDKKRAIPAMPTVVGFITSPTGAAVQDFLRILKRRNWRGRIIILPAKVQGQGAAEEMVEMLGIAQQLGIFDLLVIGRGGGSIEDLWAFNEEVLVRAVAASPVPIISAVGHEIDFVLTDFAADVRAETPSAAAELISSEFVSCLERVDHAATALVEAAENRLEQEFQRLDHARSRLRLLSPSARLERGWLKLDDLSNRLTAVLREALTEPNKRLLRVKNRLERSSPEMRLPLARQRIESLSKRLEAASPASVLNRGFVIVRDMEGRPIIRKKNIKASQLVSAEFSDGKLDFKVT
jgi:exodeoxyribonuclease VII large subunit